MNKLLSLICIVTGTIAFSQSSLHIPAQSQYVMSFSGDDILDMVSLEEIQKYDFMVEVSKDLFRDKTKSISEFGIDLNSRVNMFLGDHTDYKFYGFSMKVNDEDKFLSSSRMSATQLDKLKTRGYFIKRDELVVLKNGEFLFVEADLQWRKLNDFVDSIYVANGWEEESYNHGDYNLDALVKELESAVEEASDAEEAVDSPATIVTEAVEEIDEVIEPVIPNKYEFKDSVENVWTVEILKQFVTDFEANKSFENVNTQFKKELEEQDQALFFMDATKFYKESYEFEREIRYNPIINKNAGILQDQWYTGRINLNDDGAEGTLDFHATDNVMSVVDKMYDSKFDKTMLKYIPKNNIGFVVSNASYKESYEELKSIYMPKLEESSDNRMQLAAAVWYTWDRLINKDALFEMYSGRSFISFNGFEEMKTERYTYKYDEENFEYKEVLEEGTEILPVFVAGVSTNETEVPTKYLNALSKMEREFIEKVGDYYKILRTDLGIPIYVTVVDGLVLVSNDVRVVTDYKNGYGKDKISGKAKKSAKKCKVMYAQIDQERMLQSIPRSYVGRREYEMFQNMASKTGIFYLNFDKVKDNTMRVVADYKFNGEYENGAYHILDFINTIYLQTK